MILLPNEEDLTFDLLLVFIVCKFFVEVNGLNDELFGLLFDDDKFTDINLNLTYCYSLILYPEGVKFFQPLLQL